MAVYTASSVITCSQRGRCPQGDADCAHEVGAGAEHECEWLVAIGLACDNVARGDGSGHDHEEGQAHSKLLGSKGQRND